MGSHKEFCKMGPHKHQKQSKSIRINEITLKKANKEHMVHQARCAFLSLNALYLKDYEQLYIEHTYLPDESSQVIM